MAALYRLCMVVCSGCVVVITLVIPWGVFTRYVLGFGSEWPEPLATLLMIVFAFFAGALCYRDNMHIAVLTLPRALSERRRRALAVLVEGCMIGTAVFMLVWGEALVEITWHQVIAEFPVVSVGVSYLPVPLGGLVLALFVLEKLLTGQFGILPEYDPLEASPAAGEG